MSSYPTQNGNAQRNKQQPTLVGLGGKGSIRSLPVRLQTAPASLEISVEKSQNVKNKSTTQPGHATPWPKPQRLTILFHRDLPGRGPCYSIYQLENGNNLECPSSW